MNSYFSVFLNFYDFFIFSISLIIPLFRLVYILTSGTHVLTLLLDLRYKLFYYPLSKGFNYFGVHSLNNGFLLSTYTVNSNTFGLKIPFRFFTLSFFKYRRILSVDRESYCKVEFFNHFPVYIGFLTSFLLY